MNAVTTTDAPISAQTAETVLTTGDLSKLSAKQKVELYIATCQSLRVNHLTRPFRFLKFQGGEQMYATKDLADQLRHRDKISLEIVDRSIEAGVYTVTARATTPDGRKDEDVGAVPIDKLVGEFRSNAFMKATTKAKRRVTLSICGLGFTDESELEGMKGVQTWDYDAEPPVETPPSDARQAITDAVPMRAAAAPMPRADRIADKAAVYDTPASPAAPQPERKSWAQWADSIETAERDASNEELGKLIAKAEVAEIVRLAKQGPYSPAKDRILSAHERMEARYLADPPEPEEELPEVRIEGEEKVGAG